MVIAPVQSTYQVWEPAAAHKSEVNYEAFLTLLIATLKNQDPTQPGDPAQMLSQLASFSSVEQSIKINEKLESVLAASQGLGAGSLIGKHIRGEGGTPAGVIKSVELTGKGLVAVTIDGARVPVGAGAVVSMA